MVEHFTAKYPKPNTPKDGKHFIPNITSQTQHHKSSYTLYPQTLLPYTPKHRKHLIYRQYLKPNTQNAVNTLIQNTSNATPQYTVFSLLKHASIPTPPENTAKVFHPTPKTLHT